MCRRYSPSCLCYSCYVLLMCFVLFPKLPVAASSWPPATRQGAAQNASDLVRPRCIIIQVSVKRNSLCASLDRQQKLLSSPWFGAVKVYLPKGLLLRRSAFAQTPLAQNVYICTRACFQQPSFACKHVEWHPRNALHVQRRKRSTTLLCLQHLSSPFRPLLYLTWPTTCGISKRAKMAPACPDWPPPFCYLRGRSPV